TVMFRFPPAVPVLRRSFAVVFAVSAMLVAVPDRSVAAPACGQNGRVHACVFSFSGAAEAFSVPPGIRRVRVVAVGAPGAAFAGDAGVTGGRGAVADATVDVAGGAVLAVRVGGAGDFDRSSPAFNGGGDTGTSADFDHAGGGGGASDVRLCEPASCSVPADAGLAARLVIAGGGGGAANGGLQYSLDATSSFGLTAGNGGDAGAAGSAGHGYTFADGGGGGAPGGADGPGAAGVGGAANRTDFSLPRPGHAGSLGAGGAGCDDLGGGGGGGRYGGGGGGCGGVGGIAPNAYQSATWGAGGGGGGGSSLAPGGTTRVARADETPSVTLSWSDPDVVPPAVIVTAPADGAVYDAGTTVSAAFSCADDAAGDGIAACDGSAAAGAPIDTTPGPHRFTVTATDAAGNPTTRTVTYTVRDAPAPPSAPSPPTQPMSQARPARTVSSPRAPAGKPLVLSKLRSTGRTVRVDVSAPATLRFTIQRCATRCTTVARLIARTRTARTVRALVPLRLTRRRYRVVVSAADGHGKATTLRRMLLV
ncbi:MAG: putative glycine rich protein, partial [Conexibacter sp.]|nr:putative glycine rich protein [Conexibacter sp.]